MGICVYLQKFVPLCDTMTLFVKKNFNPNCKNISVVLAAKNFVFNLCKMYKIGYPEGCSQRLDENFTVRNLYSSKTLIYQ